MLDLSAYNSKMNSVIPIVYYRIVISIIRCNFLQSLKEFLQRGFRATLNFRKVKVALSPLRGYESLSLFLSYKRLKLKLRVFLAGHIVAMVT